MDVSFRSEKIKDAIGEAKPLLQLHYDELAHYKDIPLNPNYEEYLLSEQLGNTRSFSVREGKELIGYAVFYIRPHKHYRSLLLSSLDVMFIKKEKRGIGRSFIKFCEQMLKDEGIMVIAISIHAKHNFGKMLESIGYELTDLTFTKRIS